MFYIVSWKTKENSKSQQTLSYNHPLMDDCGMIWLENIGVEVV